MRKVTTESVTVTTNTDAIETTPLREKFRNPDRIIRRVSIQDIQV